MSDTLSPPDTFGTRVSDLLSNPAFGSLLGLTQGFAQAAMPTRMPTPFGAVLGMGAGGALQGASTAQKIGLEGQQLQSAKMRNQQQQMVLDWYKQRYGQNGSPFGAPVASGGSSLPGGANGAGGAQNNYLRSPSDIMSMGDLAMATNNDRTAAALYNLIQQQAGGTGYAMGANNTAFAVPGGSADPRVIAQNEDAKQWAGVAPAIATTAGQKAAGAPFEPPVKVDVPQYDAAGNLTGTVQQQIPVMQWANQNRGGSVATGPSGAASGVTMPGQVFAQRVVQSENPGGNPAAQNPNSSATGNGQFINSTWLGQFKQTFPDQAKGMSDDQILQLRSNPQISGALIQTNAQSNAGVLAQAGIPANATTLALAHRLGPAGAATVLRSGPNMPLSQVLPPEVIRANPDLGRQTVGQLVGNTTMTFGMAPVQFGAQSPTYGGKVTLTPQMEAALKIQTARNMPYDLRSGGMHVDPLNGQVAKNPELREITDPATGAKTYVHIQPASPFAPEGTPGTASPVTTGPGTAPVTAEIPKQQQAGRDAAVHDFLTKDQDSYQAAQNTQGWLQQIDHAADTMNQAGPLAMTGPYAQERYQFMSGINDFARSLGLKEPFNTNAVGSWEELKKATATAGFELASHYEGHARQAASTIENATSAVPAATNSPEGLKLVVGGIREAAQSAIDVHQYKQEVYNRTQGAGLESAETDFYKQFTPQMYANRAISTVHPIQITADTPQAAQLQFQKYLPGTIVNLNGQMKVVPERQGAPPIPSYMQRYIQQPGAPNG